MWDSTENVEYPKSFLRGDEHVASTPSREPTTKARARDHKQRLNDIINCASRNKM